MKEGTAIPTIDGHLYAFESVQSGYAPMQICNIMYDTKKAVYAPPEQPIVLSRVQKNKKLGTIAAETTPSLL